MNATQDDKQQPESPAREATDGSPAAEQSAEHDSGAASKEVDGDGDPTHEPPDDRDDYEESTETTYERLPSGGHRVTRRTIRRRVTITTEDEDVDEHVVEDLPVDAYRAPATPTHPSPVG